MSRQKKRTSVMLTDGSRESQNASTFHGGKTRDRSSEPASLCDSESMEGQFKLGHRSKMR